MNSLLLNREGFSMPVDGWYQLAPVGEFAHVAAGVVQVVDRDACEAMVQAFRAEAQAANFAGLLVDFDHFSLDGEKRSEAAGWIVELDCRLGDGAEAEPRIGTDGHGLGIGENSRLTNAEPQNHEGESGAGEDSTTKVTKNTKAGEAGAGLWARIRWSDVGEEAVKGGRYRFLSPVWSRGDCVDLGNGRVRPVRLLNAAVTNDPNLKGMRPLSNSGRASEQLAVSSGQGGDSTTKVTKGAKVDGSGAEREALENSGGGAGPDARFKWVLGASPEGRHCPSCLAVAGQVHTMAEWEAAGVTPGLEGLFCQEHCCCRLEATSAASSGAVVPGPSRLRNDATAGQVRNSGQLAVGSWQRMNPTTLGNYAGASGDEGGLLANIGWTDEARVASLAVRRAKAGSRGNATNGPVLKPADDGQMPPGGSRYFDEQTGRYLRLPRKVPQKDDPRQARRREHASQADAAERARQWDERIRRQVLGKV
jgi:hypothetical protein